MLHKIFHDAEQGMLSQDDSVSFILKPVPEIIISLQ